MGFDFAVPAEVEPMREWAEQVHHGLGIPIDGLERLSSAAQFARLDGERQVSFEEIAVALPEREQALKKVADGNNFPMARPMALGKAIMLSGPQWEGHLRLAGAQRRAFEEAVLERSAKAQERAEAELCVSEDPARPDGDTGSGSAMAVEE